MRGKPELYDDSVLFIAGPSDRPLFNGRGAGRLWYNEGLDETVCENAGSALAGACDRMGGKAWSEPASVVVSTCLDVQGD